MQQDYTYFVYMLNSSSRRALYTGITNALVKRTMQHRGSKDEHSFTSKYRAFRLVYYEEFGDVNAAIAREKQIKGWTRAKKNALVESMNPTWRDLIHEWEEKWGIEFQLDGRITRRGEAHKQEQQEMQNQEQKQLQQQTQNQEQKRPQQQTQNQEQKQLQQQTQNQEQKQLQQQTQGPSPPASPSAQDDNAKTKTKAKATPTTNATAKASSQ
jgi:putative endonuclease